MKQIGFARIYDETDHFVRQQTIYQDEADGAFYIMHTNPHIHFWRIPDTWKIEYAAHY